MKAPARFLIIGSLISATVAEHLTKTKSKMMQYLKPVLVTAIGCLVALIAYDMFVKGFIGNFESSNYEVNDNGDIMKVAA